MNTDASSFHGRFARESRRTSHALLWTVIAAASLHTVQAQDITFFFPAGDLSGEVDRFGNTHTVGPATAIETLPFGSDDLLDVAFDKDNKWLIYGVEGNTFLVSHAPGGLEDSPEISMDVTLAVGGKFEVILNFLDSNAIPGDAPIQAAIGDDDLMTYTELNAIRATGGTTPGYPVPDGSTLGAMWWQSVSLGEVEVETGGEFSVRVDDLESDTEEEFVTSTFQGITLRVIELTGAIAEIQVSPGVFDWATDVGGNQFKTGPQNSTLTQEDWLTVNANDSADGLWNIREGLGSYGPVIESFPLSGDDAPTLQTSVIFAKSGTYDVFFSLGDTGQVNPEENLAAPTPLNFAFEGDELTRWHANDGEFKGSPGYNDYEMSVGQVSVRAGQITNFIIDDVQDDTATRSVYLGMRFVFAGASNPFQITGLAVADDNVMVTWSPLAGKFYAVDVSPDLADWEALVTEYPAGGAAAPSIDYTDSSVPQDWVTRYYRVRQVSAPALFSTDFENGADGWTATTIAGDTQWELGTPNIGGLTTASSGTQAWGTGLNSNYMPSAHASLRSPIIDLNGVKSPELSFSYFIDSTFDAEGGQVRFLNEAGDMLASSDIFSGQTEAWTPFVLKLPDESLDQKIIVEFVFLSDPDEVVGAGWYIDDMMVD